MHSPLNEQPHEQHSASSLLSSGAQQYHQIHDNASHQQYMVRSPNRSPSSPIIPVKPSLSKHSRVGDYQGMHRWIPDIERIVLFITYINNAQDVVLKIYFLNLRDSTT